MRGSRPGERRGGRTKGTPNKRTEEVVAQARASGLLPHEFLCAVAQGQKVDGHVPTFEQRLEAAKAAAPFYAPKLATIDNKLSGNVGYTAIPVAERDPIPGMDATAGATDGSDPAPSRH